METFIVVLQSIRFPKTFIILGFAMWEDYFSLEEHIRQAEDYHHTTLRSCLVIKITTNSLDGEVQFRVNMNLKEKLRSHLVIDAVSEIYFIEEKKLQKVLKGVLAGLDRQLLKITGDWRHLILEN